LCCCGVSNFGCFSLFDGAPFQVRHPNILSFLHSTEVETVDAGSPKVTIYMVTEPVMPLSDKIKELGLEGSQRYECSFCCMMWFSC